jgi:hypothetical protein
MKRARLCRGFLALVLASGLAACSDSSKKNPFEPEIGHPENWIGDHGGSALSQGSTCPECHGADLAGGVSGLSCFTARYEGVGCHESGVGKRHTAGWSLPVEHGRVAKGRPGVSSGMGSCRACHGDDYEGGTSDVSCTSCHRVSAPHPKAPWLHGSYSHHTADDRNAPFCAECHENTESPEPDGCFNGSLCHGQKSFHEADWALAERHGADVLREGGFEECTSCHGEDFEGGTARVSCLSCHDLQAPHPRRGWIDGGSVHREVGEENLPVCATCHSEVADAPDCFTANACHGDGSEGDLPEEEPIEEEEPVEEGDPEEEPVEEEPPPEDGEPPEGTVE